jgi:8-oxo-dGTP diphosphatase
MHEWTVAGALVEQDGALLLVQNRRRDGTLDWTTPGGVIEPGEPVIDGLAREVREESGIDVVRWAPSPCYEIEVSAPGLGWHLQVEVWRAVEFRGELAIDDPDGIVEAVRFVPHDEVAALVAGNHPWVVEPMTEYLSERWADPDSRLFGFHVEGEVLRDIVVTRL